MKNFNFCNNCGKSGHLFHQCKLPITSIGIILFRKKNNTIELLMICRKNSLGFVDFMRGKYNLYNKKYILTLINRMSNNEREYLKTMEFKELWNYLWGDIVAQQYRSEEKSSMEKLNYLKNGIKINDEVYNLMSLINECNEYYCEPEWGFPKGRRNFQEKDLVCGVREFEEETGYLKEDINFIENIIPFEEIYTGTNFKSYKHKYFLAYIDNNIDATNDFQKTEISAMEWVDINNCENYIRNYSIEKINIISKIKYIINNYKIFI
jgi:ADP-ribose pyrophosphatase YjhB (NUDIX family)